MSIMRKRCSICAESRSSLSQLLLQFRFHRLGPDLVALRARVGRVGGSGPVRVIVCPHWRAGSATRVSRCPSTEALHLLIGEAFDFSAGGQSVLARLGRLVDTVPVYRLGYSDLSEAVEAVGALLDDPSSVPA